MRRRKWIVLQAAVLDSARRSGLHAHPGRRCSRASRRCSSTRGSHRPGARGDLAGRASADELDRDAATQADVAADPALARRVLRQRGRQRPDAPRSCWTTRSVRPARDPTCSSFKVRDPDPARAAGSRTPTRPSTCATAARLGAEALDRRASATCSAGWPTLGWDLTDSPLARELRSERCAGWRPWRRSRAADATRHAAGRRGREGAAEAGAATRRSGCARAGARSGARLPAGSLRPPGALRRRGGGAGGAAAAGTPAGPELRRRGVEPAAARARAGRPRGRRLPDAHVPAPDGERGAAARR